MSLAVANRYSRALAEVVFAPGSGLVPEQILAEIEALASAAGSSPELSAVLRSPAVSLAQKRNLLGKLCDRSGSSRTVRNLAFVVCDHGRTGLLADIRKSFEALVDERRGVARADIHVASETSDAQKQSLEAALARLTGKQVRASYSVDPALLGGATARIGSTVYDGSLRGQLASLKRKLVSA
jgi:F-type H+-transporting ATPase subunit delta